jgi:hypothetical protein
MNSNGDSPPVLKLPTERSLTRLVKSWQRRLRGCECCSKKIKGAHQDRKASVTDLEIAIGRGCQICSLIWEAVRSIPPSSELDAEYLRFENDEHGYFKPYLLDKSGTTRGDLHIFTLRGTESLALPMSLHTSYKVPYLQ